MPRKENSNDINSSENDSSDDNNILLITMKEIKIIGSALPNIPWEERPATSQAPLWRYSQNPIIKRDHLPDSNSILNSAVVPFGEGFAGVFRCDDKNRRMTLHAGFSKDAIHWDIREETIRFECGDAEIGEWVYGYDHRVCKIGDKYYVTWCNGYHGPTIGVAWTEDFLTFHQLENAFLPYNRNGVMFPRKINGKFAMLSRPSDTGHTAFGDIFYSESPDLEYWGHHRHVMAPAAFEESAWQCMKIGAGPVPIETSEGWLLIYHGVLHSCNGYVYAFVLLCSTWMNRGRSSLVRDSISFLLRSIMSVWVMCLTFVSHVQNFTTQRRVASLYIMVVRIRLRVWLSDISLKSSSSFAKPISCNYSF